MDPDRFHPHPAQIRWIEEARPMTFMGFRSFVDKDLPPDRVEIRDSHTDQLLGTLYNIGMEKD